MKKFIVSPSLLSGDFNNLSHDLKRMEILGVSYLHFDVMDGHFVNNISFGAPILKSIRPHYGFVMDVHLMISDPYSYVKNFAEAGADIITFHVEAYDYLKNVDTIKHIKSFKIKAGMSIKPNTDVEELLPYINDLDLILIMSVEPGWGGQSFLESSLEKIAFLRSYIDEHKLNCLISVDGGINEKTGKLCKDKGVDILVAGSYLFNKEDLKERLEALSGE